MAYVSLGSNQGDRETHLCAALAALGSSRDVVVDALSPIYETDAVGPPGQGAHLNAVVRLRTRLSPEVLLGRLLAIECDRGRNRADAGPRWGPRTLDLDLLLYADRVVDEPLLRVPHPRLAERAFVLTPLADLAADLVHPTLGVSIGELEAKRRDPLAVRPWPGGARFARSAGSDD